MAQYDHDVIVIGAGPGGYVGAIRAAQLGLDVGIIERLWWGGVCLNVGCIPTKSLLRNAELANILNYDARTFGFSFDNLELDYNAAYKRSRQVSGRLVKGIQGLLKKNGVTAYQGSATISAPETVSVRIKGENGTETKELRAKNIIIATGARARPIPGVSCDMKKITNYVGAVQMEELPEKMLVIGGGAIGMEFGYVWRSYGVEVTIVEMMDRVLPLEHPDVSKVVQRAYEKMGIRIMTGSRVNDLEKTGDGVIVHTSDGEKLENNIVMVSIGIVPNSSRLGLEDLGVETDKRGFIQVDDRMATNVPGVWAVGDVTGKKALAHVGSAMGIVCAENIAGVPTVTLNYDFMPQATYCRPQVASFGYTEEKAKEKGYEPESAEFPFRANGKALGLNEREGFVRVIADKKSGQILGAHMVGPDVTELLPELTLAAMTEMTPEEIARNVHAHPTLSEALMEVAHGLEGHMIHL